MSLAEKRFSKRKSIADCRSTLEVTGNVRPAATSSCKDTRPKCFLRGPIMIGVVTGFFRLPINLVPQWLARFQRELDALLRLLLAAERLETFALQIQQILLAHRSSR